MQEKIDKLKEMKGKIEAAKKRRSHIQGKLESSYESLSKLGYDSLEDAKKGLDELIKKMEEGEDALEIKIEDFEAKYAEHIEVPK